MKNLKTILVGLFAVVSATEITYPIIFTGPARRNAHREQKEAAYAAGLEKGAQESQFSDQDMNENYDQDFYEDNNEVAVQAMEDNDDAINEALQDAGLNDDYAAEAKIQAIEPGLAEQPAPAISQEEQMQATTTEQADSKMMPATPVVTEMPAVEPMDEAATKSTEPMAEPMAVTAESHEDKASEEQLAAQLALTAPVEEPVVAKAEEQATKEESQEIKDQAPAAPMTEEVVVAPAPVVSSAEQEITQPNNNVDVKEHTIYDTIYTAAQNAYNRAKSMFDYVYNFVAKKMSKEPEVKVQEYQTALS